MGGGGEIHNFGCANSHTPTKLPGVPAWLRTSACSPAPSLALLLTDLGCRRPRPSLPHHTHTIRHNFALTNTHTARPPNYLDVAPGDTGRYAHTRVPADPLRSAQANGAPALTPGCARWREERDAQLWLQIHCKGHPKRLPATPGDTGRYAHTSLAAGSFCCLSNGAPALMRTWTGNE